MRRCGTSSRHLLAPRPVGGQQILNGATEKLRNLDSLVGMHSGGARAKPCNSNAGDIQLFREPGLHSPLGSKNPSERRFLGGRRGHLHLSCFRVDAREINVGAHYYHLRGKDNPYLPQM